MKLVDTSSWIEYLRQTGTDTSTRVLKLLIDGEAAWCDIVALELWNGVTVQQRPKLEELERIIVLLPTDRAVWQKAKALASEARSAGKTIPATDILVAACAEFTASKLSTMGTIIST